MQRWWDAVLHRHSVQLKNRMETLQKALFQYSVKSCDGLEQVAPLFTKR